MYTKPKKRLGQNFLFDKNIQKKIISACALKREDVVLEIGPGYAGLTELIAEHVKAVYALEIDPVLCKFLKIKFEGNPKVKIIHRDFLKFDFSAGHIFGKDKIRVIGNIPYYITTPIIEKLLENRAKIKDAFIMVQKEFARRIASSCGTKDYGSFSCFVQYYAEPKVLFNVKNTSFTPRPKVDSSFMALKIRPAPCVRVKDEKLLFRLIRKAFTQRRKMLKNSLKGFSGCDSSLRPENLTLDDFAKISDLNTPA